MIASSAIGECDSIYKWNTIAAIPKLLLTNKPEHTFARAPGTMQAALWAGAVIDHVAKAMGKDRDTVMADNFYKTGDKTLGGSTVGSRSYNWTIPALWDQIQLDAEYAERKAAVAAYNAANKWTKKGIAISGSKWDLHAAMYQMGAQVCAYADGTVHVGTTGVEMGQGLNTKVGLCVANVLGIPVESIRTEGADTFTFSSGSMTGGSGTSESACHAAIQAATTLKGRLQVCGYVEICLSCLRDSMALCSSYPFCSCRSCPSLSLS